MSDDRPDYEIVMEQIVKGDWEIFNAETKECWLYAAGLSNEDIRDLTEKERWRKLTELYNCRLQDHLVVLVDELKVPVKTIVEAAPFPPNGAQRLITGIKEKRKKAAAEAAAAAAALVITPQKPDLRATAGRVEGYDDDGNGDVGAGRSEKGARGRSDAPPPPPGRNVRPRT